MGVDPHAAAASGVVAPTTVDDNALAVWRDTEVVIGGGFREVSKAVAGAIEPAQELAGIGPLREERQEAVR